MAGVGSTDQVTLSYETSNTDHNVHVHVIKY